MSTLLEGRNLSFSYVKGKPVFSNISISVNAGERLAITGHSGCGKSTLARVLAGFLKPSSGAVLFEGSPAPRKGCSPVQIVWQHPEQAVNPRWRMGKVLTEAWTPPREFLAEMGVEEAWLDRYPRELSSGEIQRFAIARALGPETKILIADEITTMLDMITQAQIWETLLRLVEKRGLALVAITHSSELAARIASRVFTFPEATPPGG